MSKLEQFLDQKYINLETCRKNGETVRTPVWFVVIDELIYIVTRENTGKVKRIKNNHNVKIMPCTFRGKQVGMWTSGQATFVKNEEAEKAIKWTHNAKIETVGYYMIGLPQETPETIRKTIEFAKKLDCTYAQFAITMPFPGNKLYDEAVKSGLVKLDDAWDQFVYSGVGAGGIQAPVLTTNSLSANDLGDVVIANSYVKA